MLNNPEPNPELPSILEAKLRPLMDIEDTTIGSSKDGYLYRFRGKLRSTDTIQTYKAVEELVKPYNLLPLFRWDEGRHSVLIVSGLTTRKGLDSKINLFLFIATLFSVILTGGLNTVEPLPQGLWAITLEIIKRGWPFAVSLLGILAAHEFGHYFVGRWRKVDVSLPFFIPLPPPLSIFGTMGAFINMRSIPRNRRDLFDIGIAGPLSGLVVAIPVLFLGLSLSELTVVQASAPPSVGIMEGNSIFYLLAKYLTFGQWLPQPASFENLSPIVYWVKYFFTGRPVPIGGLDVMIHPVAWAGWAGLLVTMLNLIPAGQLDGGHISQVVFGSKGAQKVMTVVLVALLAMGFAWSGWWLWAGLIFWLGRRQAEPMDSITPLDTKRRVIGILMIILFLLLFIPVPLLLY